MSDLSSMQIVRLVARVTSLVRRGRSIQARRLLAQAWADAAERLDRAPPSGGKFLGLVADFEARHERTQRAASLSRQGSRRFRRQGADHDALALALDALAAALEVIGTTTGGVLTPQDRVLLAGYRRLAAGHVAEGCPEKAEPILHRVLAIHGKADGESHALYAWTLGELADLSKIKGDLLAARDAAGGAVDVYRSLLPCGHPGLVPSLHRLAALDAETGDWVAAAPLLQEASEIYGRCLGADHRGLARIRRGLADVYVRLEDFGRAEELYELAIAALLQRSGTASLHLSRLLLALAHVQRSQGLPERAKDAFHRAWKTAVRALGRDHPLTASIANDLGTLYAELGRPNGARALYGHAACVLRRAPRERFAALGGCLNNLALLVRHHGGPGPAAELLGEHLNLRRRVLGSDDPGRARSLFHLAAARQEEGEAGEAERLCRLAVVHAHEVLGPGHPVWAEAAAHLARTLAHARRWSEAEALYRRARRVWHRALGPRHPWLAEVHLDLAAICAATGRGRETLEELSRCGAIDDGWLRRVPLTLLARPWSPVPSLRVRLEKCLDLVGSHFFGDEHAAGWAFALTLRRKGLAHDLGALMDSSPSSASSTPGAEDCLQLEAQIVRRWLAGPGTADLALHRRLLASWFRRRRHLERDIVAAELRPPTVPRAAAFPIFGGRLGQSLGRDGALLELVRCRGYREDARYLGFLVTPRAPVRMLDLGDAGLVDLSLHEDLGRALLEPLALSLEGCRRLFLAPDGDSREYLRFEKLASQGKTLLPTGCSVTLVRTGRDLLSHGR